MSPKRFDPESIRATILASLPEQSFAEEQPALGYLYVPHAHARALHPDTMLVRGIRGAGKSFWWGALRIPEYPDGRMNMPDVYRVGFGVGRKGGVKPLR